MVADYQVNRVDIRDAPEQWRAVVEDIADRQRLCRGVAEVGLQAVLTTLNPSVIPGINDTYELPLLTPDDTDPRLRVLNPVIEELASSVDLSDGRIWTLGMGIGTLLFLHGWADLSKRQAPQCPHDEDSAATTIRTFDVPEADQAFVGALIGVDGPVHQMATRWAFPMDDGPVTELGASAVVRGGHHQPQAEAVLINVNGATKKHAVLTVESLSIHHGFPDLRYADVKTVQGFGHALTIVGGVQPA